MANSKYHHEEMVRGKDLVKKLGLHKITVCGAGAIGSNLIESLARQGFTSLKVIDFDRINLHNVNNQVYVEGDVGALKVAALKTRIFRAVGVELATTDKKLESGNIKKELKDAALVVDTFDNSESRQLVQDHCRANNIPCLHTGMFEDYGEVVWDDHPYRVPANAKGDVCDYPLARNLVVLVTGIAGEEIQDHCLAKKPRHLSWSITLKDLSIRNI